MQVASKNHDEQDVGRKPGWNGYVAKKQWQKKQQANVKTNVTETTSLKAKPAVIWTYRYAALQAVHTAEDKEIFAA